MPLILGANSVSGYTVKNSLRFNSGSTDYLNRTPATTTNQKTFTYSGWYKKSVNSAVTNIIEAGYGNSARYTLVQITSSDTIRFLSANYTTSATTSNSEIITTQVFRDPSAWYHIMLVVDTTQATASNRVKIYVNGSQITNFSTASYPSLNDNTYFNVNTTPIFIGYTTVNGYGFNGYQSEINFIDGQALTPSSFGETDFDTGIWKPKAYTGTYGTNGFYLQFKNSASLGTDSSGNGNTFTVNNLTSIDQTTDTPTNNFCTMNPLDNFYAGSTFTEGNTQVAQPAGSECFNTGTFGVTKGKWYWETKVIVTGTSGDFAGGISDIVATSATATPPGQTANNYGYNGNNGQIRNNATSVAYGNTYTTNDIISTYLDLDNNKLYFGKNGTVQNSGTGFTITAPSSTTGGIYYPIVGERHTNANTLNVNFGNPSFSIASGNTDANGYGNFEYDPSSGTFDGTSKQFLSLCTKNLSDKG
jgi:hypothetical protein